MDRETMWGNNHRIDNNPTLTMELDRLEEKEEIDWIRERMILLANTGSFAYGTNTEESDRDYKGICIPPIEYMLGLKHFNEYNSAGVRHIKVWQGM